MCKINGKKLEELRLAAGVSKKELAKAAGISPTSITNYEKGVSNPEDANVDKICMILKINKKDIQIHDVGYNFMNSESKTVAKVRKQKDFVRLFTPEQTEAWLEKRRTESDEKIRYEIKNKLRHCISIGNKRYISIDPTFIHIPDWQRDTDMAKATEIAENFDENKFDPVKIYIKADYTSDVADGAHRIIALAKYNENVSSEDEKMEILAEVLNCDEDNAALTFLGQGSGRKNMTVNDTYRAGIRANIEEYVNFKYLFESENVQITADKHRLENPIGKITPSATALRFVMRDREMLVKSIALIKKLEWCGSEKNAFVLRNFKVIKKLYANYGDEVESKLLDNCKGAVFYESKVAPVKSNAELYDILSEEISK